MHLSNVQLVCRLLLGLQPQCFHGQWPRHVAAFEGTTSTSLEVNHMTIKNPHCIHSPRHDDPKKLQARKDKSARVRQEMNIDNMRERSRIFEHELDYRAILFDAMV